MIVVKKGIGILKNITYAELQSLLRNIPSNWEYDYECTYKSTVDKKYNNYKLKLYRKCEETE